MGNTVNFEQGNDTGEADEQAVAPIANGEDADKDVFNRPIEALRHRSEVLRAEVNENRWIRDADRSIQMWLEGGGSLGWGGTTGNGGTGVITLNTGSLFVAPMRGPGEARGNADEFSGTKFVSLKSSLQIDDGANGMLLQSKIYEHQGANEISIEIIADPGASASVTVNVEGDGTVSDGSTQPAQDNIVITYDSTTPPQISTVITAIQAEPVANALVSVSGVGDTAQDIFAQAETRLSGAVDGVFHEIPSTVFSSWDDGIRELQEGDTLALYYTADTRRESIEELGNEEVTVSNLINLTTNPEKVADSIPIARVIGGDLIFANNAFLADGDSTTSMQGVDSANVRVDGSSWTMVTSASDAQSAFDNVDSTMQSETDAIDATITQLRGDIETGAASPPAPGGGTSGSEFVGLSDAGYTYLNESFNTVQQGFDALETILTELDEQVGTDGNHIQSAVISGCGVSNNGNGTVAVSSGQVRSASGAAGIRNTAYVKDISAISSISFGSDGSYFVFYDNSGDIIDTTSEASFGATATEDVPLAWVEITAGSVTNLVDVRDYASNLERETPITVGEEGRFDTLEAAFKIIEFGRANSREVVVRGSHNVFSKNLNIPDGTTLRGENENATLEFGYVDLTGTDSLFIPGQNVTVKDLKFTHSGGFSGGGEILRTTYSENFRFENLRMEDPDGSNLIYISGFGSTGVIRDCVVTNTGTPGIYVESTAASPSPESIYIENCDVDTTSTQGKFVGATLVGCNINANDIDLEYVRASDTTFATAVVAISSSFTGCSFSGTSLDDCTLTGCSMGATFAAASKLIGCDISSSSGTALHGTISNVDTSIELKIRDCRIDFSGTDAVGIDTDGGDVSVIGCTIVSGGSGTGTRGILVKESDEVIINGCTLVGPNAGYGIEYAAPVTSSNANCVLTSTVLRDWKSTGSGGGFLFTDAPTGIYAIAVQTVNCGSPGYDDGGYASWDDTFVG